VKEFRQGDFLQMKATLSAAFALVSLGAIPLAAHHSFAAEYDSKQPIKIQGTVTKLEWTNPHARFYVDVTDAAGKTVNWNFELASPNVLTRSGWKRNSLKPGDKIVVEGARAKDGSLMANARLVTLADGKRVFAGSSGGDAPPPPADATAPAVGR
jgi:hypothetical protein